MDDTITTIYCLCDHFLKAMPHRRDDPQARLSTAEVMTIPLVAATFFDGNIDKRGLFLHEYGYMPKMISKSHLNGRLHRIEPTLWWVLFELLARVFKERNDPEFQTQAVDSLPVPVCDNIRIRRCRIYPLEEGDDDGIPKKESFRGYIASKRRYFYGLRVHLVVTGAGGEPVEFSLAAGSEADVAVFKDLELDLPEGSIICAEKGYTDYDYEDLLEEVGLHLKAQRKKNSKREMPAWEEFLGKPIRQYIETVFSRLTNLFAKKIHAVTPRGFELKIVWFLLAFSIQCLQGALGLGSERIVTRGLGNIIYEIDGKPAMEVFEEYILEGTLTDDRDWFPYAVSLSLCFKAPSYMKDEEYVVRGMPVVSMADGSITVQTEVPEGTSVWLSSRDKDKVSNGFDRMAQQIKQQLGGEKPKLIFQFECSTRGKMMFRYQEKLQILKRFRQSLDPDAPWVGFYTVREIGPVEEHNLRHPYTSVVLALS